MACVTSTAFIVPGLSALMIEHMKLPRNTQRVDIVGMGCNAGLNGMNTVSSWSKAHPGKNALLVCCELSSCIYTVDEEENTALVNSLFGDGISVAVLRTDDAESSTTPEIVQFQSYMIPDSLDCLRFNFVGDKNRYNFYVDKKTPQNLASYIEAPLHQLFSENKITMSDIKHFVFHTGGDAILTGIEKKLGLSNTALRHTRSVLKDYGNISSGSFLFSYERLMEEKPVAGYGLMVTMGPGLTIETALLKWS
jgi:predicted naringenin-chalcone synthase